MARQSRFNVTSVPEQGTGTTLIVGQSHPGMAGVTAVDYLVRQLESREIGHIAPEGLPAIAPFENGVPRHHTRLYTLDGSDLTVLIGELFIPTGVARPYADALLAWATEQNIDEIVILHGVPFPHGPDEHEVFHVATPAYRERRLADEPIRPLKGGILDGVAGEVVTRSLDETAPETGVFTTPTHPPGPDIDAAIRLLNAIETLYGFDVDETELRQLGHQLQQYYEQLADRMAAIAESEDSITSHDYPEDRMYM